MFPLLLMCARALNNSFLLFFRFVRSFPSCIFHGAHFFSLFLPRMFILSFENYKVESTFGSVYENEYAHRNCAKLARTAGEGEQKRRQKSTSNIYVCRIFCVSVVSLLWTRFVVVRCPHASIWYCIAILVCGACVLFYILHISIYIVMVILFQFRISGVFSRETERTKRKDKNVEVPGYDRSKKLPNTLHLAFV